MAEQRTIEIRVVLNNDEPISPSEFLDLFRCGDEFSRHIAQQEALALLDDIGVPGDVRLATLQHIHQLGRRLPSPAEVQAVEKGSWLVVLTIASPALLYVLKEYVHPSLSKRGTRAMRVSTSLPFFVIVYSASRGRRPKRKQLSPRAMAIFKWLGSRATMTR